MWGITDMPNANFSSIYNPESDVLGKVQYQRPYFSPGKSPKTAVTTISC